ncbi:AMP-binding protein [Modestobacter sp. I12A-02628]|uniref:Acyl--CoA ligase n=1 Tax=Goekera deserti TaxID=2497753 RepID=A0A7K3WDU4_9ACTN|nr:class I adenylate-forming enzyme family protein [Goekera deserti]MPQ97190.1 AMP-binding protein [Goekera deserti]NDI46492.1 AMP-binding protein [Goekera deserti]NEL54574.1 acyl--CoA ligase [Goekera deserti]
MADHAPVKLVELLLGPAGTDPHRVCVIADGRPWTRAEVGAAVGRCADDLLEQGLRPGQRVLALLDHDLRGITFLAAASALGLRVLMPYNLHAAAAAEWLTIAAAARPDAVVHLTRDRAAVPALREAGCRVVELGEGGPPAPRGGPGPRIHQPEPTAQFLILFTSGTTGAPKAISVSEELVCRRVLSVTRALDFDAGSRVFMSGLLNNTTGVIFAFGALHHDALLIVPTGREIENWPAEVARHGITHVMLRPVAMKRFVESAAAGGEDLSSLRTVAYGAAAMPRGLLEAGRALMPCSWVQGYGLSETFGPFCWLDEAGHRDRRYRGEPYCVGRPDETVEVRLEPVAGHPGGVGEVLVRGPGLMEGYLDIASGALTPPGDWLRTGDLASWSRHGDLLLKGRKAGALLSADGHRIYPEEVEAVLADVPGVDGAVVVGVAAGGPAERPVACISGALAGCRPATVRDVVCRALGPVLSREKWPDLLYPVPAPLPTSTNDKVMRAEIRRRIDVAALIEL